MLELFKANTEYVFDTEKIKVGGVIAYRRIATDGSLDEIPSLELAPMSNALVTYIDGESLRVLTHSGEYIDIRSSEVVDSPSFDLLNGVAVRIYTVVDSVYTGE
ncbi:hypothetical protein [Phage f2b1]|nr:hypothetical protein [Phage f2b1]